MAATIVIRGNIVDITATFVDVDEVEVLPTSADVIFNYLTSAGTRTNSDPVAMETNSDGLYAATWSSADAYPGRVYWSVRATDPEAAEDGYFDIVANLANLAT